MSNETYVTLVGRLTADPEARVTPQGATVATFTVATNPRVRNRDTGTWEDGPSSFHDCEVWQAQAEHAVDSLRKASRVIVFGTLHQVAFTTKAGENRRKWVVKVEDVGPSLRFVSASLSESDGVRRASRTQPVADVSGYGSGMSAAAADPWA